MNQSGKIQSSQICHSPLNNRLASSPENLRLNSLTKNQVYKEIEKGNHKIVFATFKQTPNEIIEDAIKMNLDLNKLIDESKIVFANFTPIKITEEIGSDYSLSPILDRIAFAIGKIGATKIILSEVDHLLNSFSNKRLVKKEISRIYEDLEAIRIEIINHED